MNGKIFLLLGMLCFPLIGSVWAQHETLEDNKISEISPAQGSEADSISVRVSRPQFIWISGYVKIIYSSELQGRLIYSLSEEEGRIGTQDDYRSLDGDGISRTITLALEPKYTALPGRYVLQVRLYYRDQENSDTVTIYEQDFEMIVGLGYLFGILTLIAFLTALIVILTSKFGEEELEPEKISEKESEKLMEGVPAGKIKCPKCKELIREGLSFCPECGSRIPEFLQYNPNN